MATAGAQVFFGVALEILQMVTGTILLFPILVLMILCVCMLIVNLLHKKAIPAMKQLMIQQAPWYWGVYSLYIEVLTIVTTRAK